MVHPHTVSWFGTTCVAGLGDELSQLWHSHALDKHASLKHTKQIQMHELRAHVMCRKGQNAT